MRKLKFTSKTSDPTPQSCQKTQNYVTVLLKENLGQYGFLAENQSDSAALSVSVENHEVGLGVSCSARGENGALVCEINAYADESQDWFKKIETQSMIKQLAQAVEETLRNDQNLSEFEWKG